MPFFEAERNLVESSEISARQVGKLPLLLSRFEHWAMQKVTLTIIH